MRVRVFILFFFLSISSFSQNDIYFYKDIDSKLDNKNLENIQFKLLEEAILDGYSNDTYWFKIPSIETGSEYVFRILYDQINTANVYQNSIKIEKLQNQRYLSYRFSRDYDVYIKMNPKLHSYIPVELHSLDKSILKEKNQLLLNGFYYGFAFLIIIYNLYYYFLFKDDSFLYYALFLACMSFGVFTMDGMLNFYNLSENTNNIIMILNYVFLAYFSSKFANSYLFLEIHYPKLKKFSYSIGFVILILGALFLIFKNYYYLLFLNILVFLLLFLYWFTSLLLFRKNVYIKILAFAYVIILFSGIDYFILKFFSISIINIDPVSIKIGSFLEMIALSVAVLYRMKILKTENEFMYNEIVNYSKELNQLNSTNNVVKNKVDDLSIREREIFDLIVSGKSNKEIASELNISVNTVKFHIKNVYDKLNIKSRKEVLSMAKNTVL